MSTEEGSHGRLLVRWAAGSLALVGRGPQRPLEHLRDVSAAQWSLVRAVSYLVSAARREGATWAEIGLALGLTRQGAAALYARDVARAGVRRENRVWFPGGNVPREWLPVERLRRRSDGA